MLMQKCDTLCQTYFYHSSAKYTKFQRFHLPSKSCKETCHRKAFGFENICVWIWHLLMSINPRQLSECIFYFNPSKSEIIFKYAWWCININLFTVCFFMGWAVLLFFLKVIPVWNWNWNFNWNFTSLGNFDIIYCGSVWCCIYKVELFFRSLIALFLSLN